MGEPISYSIKGAVAATGLSRATLYRYIQAGRIQPKKCGTATIIPAAQLRALVESLPDFLDAA